MKQNRLPIIICLILLLGVISCNPQPEADRLLRLAQEMVETDPDSAMNLIDSIYYPENSLSHKRYMEFLVTRTQAKYKTYQPIDEDTIVFKARDYFEKRSNNPERTALAWFYSGCVYREQEKYTDAMHHYKEAERYSLLTENIVLKGLIQYNIGDLLAEQNLYIEALEYYKASESFYAQSLNKTYIRRSNCLSAVGRMHMLCQQPDSALYYFHKGLEIAEDYKDNKLQCLLSQNLSVVYLHVYQLDKAETYLRQAYILDNDSNNIPRYYLNFAELYTKIGNNDSISFYTNKLKHNLDSNVPNNIYFKISAYSYISEQKKSQGDYESALYYREKNENQIVDKLKADITKSVFEIQQKYDYAQAQNKMLKSQMSTRTLFGVVGLLFVILVMVLLIWRRQKKTANLEKDYTEAKLLLSQQKTEEKQRIISVALPYLNLHSSIQNQLLEFASKVRGKDKKLGDALDELLKGNRSAFNDTTQQIFTDELMHEVVGISRGLELLNPSDRLLILMLAIDVDNNNIAALLNTTPMNLKSKKSYLKKKLQNNADQFDNYDFLISIF